MARHPGEPRGARRSRPADGDRHTFSERGVSDRTARVDASSDLRCRPDTSLAGWGAARPARRPDGAVLHDVGFRSSDRRPPGGKKIRACARSCVTTSLPMFFWRSAASLGCPELNIDRNPCRVAWLPPASRRSKYLLGSLVGECLLHPARSRRRRCSRGQRGPQSILCPHGFASMMQAATDRPTPKTQSTTT